MKAVYIHIPFCSNICTYCDFCKMYYNKKHVTKYLEELEKEIKNNYNGETIETIYIGGGTPSSLDLEELEYLLKITEYFKTNNNLEFTVECNIENCSYEKLELLKKYNVNRLSFGVQTFNPNFLKVLGRKHNKEETFNIIKFAKELGFDNINIDLMYAFNGQTIDDLKKDLDLFLKLNINHISTYSLIIEPNTVLGINNYENIDEDLDYEMYRLIENTLKEHGYKHYETSNFAKEEFVSKHNLTYWNNLEYYGFGLGASGYINGIRYNNTRSLNNYLKGNYVLDKHELSKQEKMEEEMFLGLRKLDGVNKKDFKNKYGIDIKDAFDIDPEIKKGLLIDDGNNIYIPEKYQYISNQVLIKFIGE